MNRILMPPIDVNGNGWSDQDLNEAGSVILSGPGTLESYDFFNGSSGIRSVLLFNAATAGAVDLGTDTPVFMHGLAASGGGIEKSKPTYWSIGCVAFAIEGTDPAGTTGAGANEVIGNALTSNRQS